MMIDAAIAGQGKYAGKLYFFRGRHYVRFDVATRRVDAGYPLTLAAWRLPDDRLFARVGAALEGVGAAYAGKAYFFAGPQYRRYDWASEAIDGGYPLGLEEWSLTGAFAGGLDAAVNGRGSRAGKAYFFRGAYYTRYDWAADRIDGGYPKPITSWRLPSMLDGGVDAALNGTGAEANKLYFFKDAQCVRYDGASGSVDAGYPRAIADEFPGVLEMLAVGAALDVGRDWVDKAVESLAFAMAALPKELAAHAAGLGIALSHPPVYRHALVTHFKLTSPPERFTYLARIEAFFKRLREVLDESVTRFRFRTLAEAKVDGVPNNDPAYHMGGVVSFTPTFLNFGPLCQAAMVVHESLHVADPDSGTAEAHIYEWGPAYDKQPKEHALHNASAYAMFAQQVFYGTDERYGIGRPTL